MRDSVWREENAKRSQPSEPPAHSAIAHIGAAAGWLLLAIVCGVMLAALPMSEATLRVALVYGVFGLVGFLAQSVVGFGRRTLPIAVVYWSVERTGRPPAPRADVRGFTAGHPPLTSGTRLANHPTAWDPCA